MICFHYHPKYSSLKLRCYKSPLSYTTSEIFVNLQALYSQYVHSCPAKVPSIGRYRYLISVKAKSELSVSVVKVVSSQV